MSFSQAFWAAQEIPTIPLLRELADFVLAHNERRLPKWRFKFADDLAVQIQPQPTRKHALLFEGLALQVDGVTAKNFTELKLLRDSSYRKIGFKIFADLSADEAWFFKPKLAGPSYDEDGLLEFRQRVADALHPDRFAGLKPDLMLKPHCLVCGRLLTDPVSQARWVGPECWGSASNNLPHIFDAKGGK
jgi:hypothetical protein